MMTQVLFILMGVILGALVVFMMLRRAGAKAPLEEVKTQTIFERVSAVGRLVGLEVYAKEIATSRKGWGWMPPIILSQAKLAMIFHFEKQYSIDLMKLRPGDVSEPAPGRFHITLPPIEGSLRLTDVTPYDIQAGRVLGLLDIIQVNAPTQQELMRSAQVQAAGLYEANAARYEAEARRSVERQLCALLSLFRVDIEFSWRDGDAPARERDELVGSARGA